MFKEVRLRKFKRFDDETFKLKEAGLIVCAGPNSSGKSTLLHALAVWSFGVSVVRQFKGDAAVRRGYRGQGAGISDDDFTPISIPDLKHLWKDLKYGGSAASYGMSITAKWDETSDGALPPIERSLTMACKRCPGPTFRLNLQAAIALSVEICTGGVSGSPSGAQNGGRWVCGAASGSCSEAAMVG